MMKPYTFVDDKKFSYATAETSDDGTPIVAGTRLPPINYNTTTDIFNNVRPSGSATSSQGLLGGGRGNLFGSTRPSIGGSPTGGIFGNVRGTTDALLGTRPRFKPTGSFDGMLFIKKNKRLSEYRKLHQNLFNLLLQFKTSTGIEAEAVQAKIAQLQNSIDKMDKANDNLITMSSSQAIPPTVVSLIKQNPEATDEVVADIVEQEAKGTPIVIEEQTSVIEKVAEKPEEKSKVGMLLPILAVGAVLYFVFKK